jgi:hypothetical protein
MRGQLSITAHAREWTMNEKELAKLVKKTVAKAAKAKAPQRKKYDKTLEINRPETDEDIENAEFFKEMKKREF